MVKGYICGLAVALTAAIGLSPVSTFAETKEERIKIIQNQIDALEDELIRLEEMEDSDKDDEVTKSTQTEDNSGDELKEDIEIIKDYTLTNSWYTRHYYIVKNNTDKTVDVTTRTTAYDESGETVGYEEGMVDALGPGCTSVIYEMYDTDKTISDYEVDLRYDTSSYDSVIQDLSYECSDLGDGAVFEITNNGDKKAEFVEGYAFFFLDGELVEVDNTYFTDDDSEIKPGRSEKGQLSTYDTPYDLIEFYMTGRHSNW